MDEPFHKGLKELRAHYGKNPGVNNIHTSDNCLFEGRSIIFNRMTPLHPDKSDLKGGWAFMVALGDFKSGGDLRVPKLNLEMQYLPGDLIAIRGRLLPHEVLAWDKGQRISIVHFTHAQNWAFAHIPDPMYEDSRLD